MALLDFERLQYSELRQGSLLGECISHLTVLVLVSSVLILIEYGIVYCLVFCVLCRFHLWTPQPGNLPSDLRKLPVLARQLRHFIPWNLIFLRYTGAVASEELLF